MSTSTPKPLALRFRWDASHFYSAKSIVIRGSVVEQGSDGRWLNIVSDWESPLHDFAVEGRLTEWCADDRSVNYEYEYRDAYAINLARAKTMVTVLTKVERGLERIEREQGRPANFGQYMARVATIVGIKTVVLDDSLGRHGERELPTGAAAESLNYVIDRWRETGGAEPFGARAA